jgi:glycosyltransferase involved in cell wall biosynthesis
MSETRRPRLAIISSWNTNCGNASYTYVLKKGFEKFYDVEVLGLDLFLLQRTDKAFRKLGRQHIRQMAAQLKKFDYVNIQFEAGLFGSVLADIKRNVITLLRAAPNVILTMHRIDVDETSLFADIIQTVVRMSPKPLQRRRAVGSYARLYRDIIKEAKRQSYIKNVWLKVHTKRERRVAEELYRFKKVRDAPLAYLDSESRSRILADVSPELLRERYKLPANAKIIGAFGYVAAYKGFETLLETIKILPPEWFLMIVGSQHPQSIKPWANISPYLSTLINSVEAGKAENFDWMPEDIRRQVRLTGTLDHEAWNARSNNPLYDRVRFVGNVDDDEFTYLLRNVDATVLPYLEVGQSMSGVVALAIESGARLFCANNLSFAENRRYYGDVFSRFDMGNYIEIAQKVVHDQSDYTEQREMMYRKYNIDTLIELHRKMFEGTAS